MASADMDTKKLGGYAFLLGLVVAVASGLAASAVAQYATTISIVLVVLGLIVGFLNIADKEITAFLVAAIALTASALIAGSLLRLDTVVNGLGTALSGAVINIGVFVAPAALVVAVKAVWDAASA